MVSVGASFGVSVKGELAGRGARGEEPGVRGERECECERWAMRVSVSVMGERECGCECECKCEG